MEPDTRRKEPNNRRVEPDTRRKELDTQRKESDTSSPTNIPQHGETHIPCTDDGPGAIPEPEFEFSSKNYKNVCMYAMYVTLKEDDPVV